MSCPERNATPRDDRTGWERHHEPDRCACGRLVVVAGCCQWCMNEPEEDDDRIAQMGLRK